MIRSCRAWSLLGCPELPSPCFQRNLQTHLPDREPFRVMALSVPFSNAVVSQT